MALERRLISNAAPIVFPLHQVKICFNMGVVLTSLDGRNMALLRGLIHSPSARNLAC
jgi:hypothetical protein